jgi:hypothetical protein
MSTLSDQTTTPIAPPEPPDHIAHTAVQDAHRDVLLAVQRGLAASWTEDSPRIAVVEHDGVATVYVSTVATLGAQLRSDIRGAVRAALAEYVRLAPFTNVVFLTRGRP